MPDSIMAVKEKAMANPTMLILLIPCNFKIYCKKDKNAALAPISQMKKKLAAILNATVATLIMAGTFVLWAA